MTLLTHPELALTDLLGRHERADLLRFITCGSVDDGKSTLIGRLLHDSKRLLDDQLAALQRDSRRHGNAGEKLDFALLLDGLAAEREQGITIDVAYRYFSTDRRKFIVADCPGHAQYTRNMATGASTADAAIVLVDARKGLLTQTRRHSWILALMGVRHVVLAVNKMDLVDYDKAVFDGIAAAYRTLAEELGLPSVQAVPICARDGDNLAASSTHMPWYTGPTLLALLETLPLPDTALAAPLRFPVQWVNRPHQDFRGLSGTLASGQVRPGDEVIVLPSGRRAQIDRIVTAEGDLDVAIAGQAVTLTLDRDLDASRGDVIVAAQQPCEVSDQFSVHLLWMDDAPLLPGRRYWLKLGTRTVDATVTEIRHRIDVDTQASVAARELQLNEVAVCHLATHAPLPFSPKEQQRELANFILIDRETHATAAAGTIDFALRRAGNIHWQAVDVDKSARATSLGQTPRCLWFTGLSGAGKSTIANRVEQQLHARGRHVYLLDGDNLRHGLNRDLGFTDADRVENIRRVAEVARLMVDAGLIVLVSFISPFRAEREAARALFESGEFAEVFVDTALEVAEARDVKGLYAKARAGQLPNFTGIDSPYEPPASPEIHLDTATEEADALAAKVLDWLEAQGR